MNNETASMKNYLNTMRKSINQNRILVVVDTNDADYASEENILDPDDRHYPPLMKVEAAIVLKTLYGDSHELEDPVEEILSRYNLDYDKYEQMVDITMQEALYSPEGHSLKQITVYYDGILYEVRAVSIDEVQKIFDRWLEVWV